MNAFSRPRLRSSRSRMRRIDRIFERILYCVLVIMFLFVSTSMFSRLEALQISNVKVVGANAVEDSQIERIAREFLAQKLLWKIERNNFIFYPKHALRTALYESDAHIEQVVLSVEPHQTLNVEIKEYQPALLWCDPILLTLSASSSESCYLANDAGYVYASAPVYSGYPFVVFRSSIAGMEEVGTPIGLFVLPEEDFAKIAEFRTALRTKGVITREVTQMGEGDYQFLVDDGMRIEWSVRRDPSESAENLQSALLEMGANVKSKKSTSTQSTIDLRFEDKIFYR